MKTKYVEKPSPLTDGLRIIPECDKDIIALGKLDIKAKKIDPACCELKFKDGHLMYFYITVEALMSTAIYGG